MTAEELAAAASAWTGLHDFGDEAEYLPGLRKLLRAFDEDKVPFTAMGQQVAFGALVGPLAGRLHAVDGWKQRPDCLSKPISTPIIILGLPRTGTTALFHLLWLDPQFQGAEMWLIDAPMPRPPRETWSSNPAHQQSVTAIAGLLAIAPGFAVAHPRDPDLPDECLDIIKQCYATTLWGTMFPVPSYDAWWPQQDHPLQYRYLRRALQLIGADDHRRWLLKDPTSIMHLPALFKTFPDLSVIVTHRDPAEVIASLCSLLRGLMTPMLGDKLDMQRVAEREMAVWSRGANALVDGIPASQRRVDVQCGDFQADPMRVVRGIYEQLGLTLSSEAETAMLQHLAKTKAQPRQPHIYTREEFGLDADRIREKFAPYIEHCRPVIRQ
jgi:Sulfotransferase family